MERVFISDTPPSALKSPVLGRYLKDVAVGTCQKLGTKPAALINAIKVFVSMSSRD